MKRANRTIYFDHAAATPIDPRVLNAMSPFLTSSFGNPSSLHHKGIEAKEAIDVSRKIIADAITARPEEIVFTSGGTESCNLAILGATSRQHKPGHLITTTIEHHAVLEPIKVLESKRWKVAYLPVSGEGFIKIDDLRKAIRKDTVLVSVMYANNEIGTVEPIGDIGRALSRVNEERQKRGLGQIFFHTDACQAAGSLDLNVNRLQVDLMSVSASKIYGPKGVGFLYARKGTPIQPIILGGGQERELRSGTENVAGVAGMAKALELAQNSSEKENKKLTGLRDYFIGKIRKALPGAILNGPQIEKELVPPFRDGRHETGVHGNYQSSSTAERLPNNINITIPGVEGEALMLYLDASGICVSTGSACTTGSTDASHVLLAIGRSEKQAKESIRITLGKSTTKEDLDYTLKVLEKCVRLIK